MKSRLRLITLVTAGLLQMSLSSAQADGSSHQFQPPVQRPDAVIEMEVRPRPEQRPQRPPRRPQPRPQQHEDESPHSGGPIIHHHYHFHGSPQQNAPNLVVPPFQGFPQPQYQPMGLICYLDDPSYNPHYRWCFAEFPGPLGDRCPCRIHPGIPPIWGIIGN